MSAAGALVRSMRPTQWTKNLIVFMPAIFGGLLLDGRILVREIAAFAVLSALSGAVYIVNDIHDAEADRAYDKTRNRPIAAGSLSPATAWPFAGGLALVALAAAAVLEPLFALIMLCYVALQIAYTYRLKALVVLDVLAIAAGFVLRAVAGAVVAGVPNSPWLLACTVSLVLFLAVGERRLELAELGTKAATHRPVLGAYSRSSLDAMLAATLGTTAVTYLVYTLIAEGAQDKPYMVLTVPFVIYGLIRYVALLYAEGPTKSAEELLLTDIPIIVDVTLWLVAVVLVVYVL